VPGNLAVLRGTLPRDAEQADLVLINPEAVYYEPVVATLTSRRPDLRLASIHPNIAALGLSERGKALLDAR
jgi:hypothetical protein